VRIARTVLGVGGELAITTGVLLLLLAWELGVVGVTANQAQAATVETLERRFAPTSPPSSPPSSPSTSLPTSPAAAPVASADDPFAILRIPRLGPGGAKPVYEGVAPNVLAEGISH
jgi:sortase A